MQKQTMPPTVPALVTVIVLAASASGALAWGPITHAAHLHETDSAELSADEQAAIRAEPAAFQLGSVMPDMRELAMVDQHAWLASLLRNQAGWAVPRYVAPGVSTHSLPFALDLVQTARSIPTSDPARARKLAFALGWLAHLAGDTVSQSTYTAKKMCECGLVANNSAETLVELSADRRLYTQGYRPEGHSKSHDVRAELLLATSSPQPDLITFLHGVLTSPRWNSSISFADLENNFAGFRQVVHAYCGHSALVVIARTLRWLVDGLLALVDLVPGAGWLIPDLLLASTYRDLPLYVAIGNGALGGLLSAAGPGAPRTDPWLGWTTINYYSLLFGAQQWYNRLSPGRQANRDGLVVHDFAFRRADTGQRIDLARPEIGEGPGVEVALDLGAWKPLDHEIRIVVRRDVARWFDRTVVSRNLNVRFTRKDLLSGVRTVETLPFSFGKKKYRWSHRWRSYTRGFYLEAYLNRPGFLRRESFSSKAATWTRWLQGDDTYRRFPFSLRIDPGAGALHSARAGSFGPTGEGNVPVPTHRDRLAP